MDEATIAETARTYGLVMATTSTLVAFALYKIIANMYGAIRKEGQEIGNN